MSTEMERMLDRPNETDIEDAKIIFEGIWKEIGFDHTDIQKENCVWSIGSALCRARRLGRE